MCQGTRPRDINKYRFKIQDGKLFNVYLRDGVLCVVTGTRFSDGYNVLHECPFDEDAQFILHDGVKGVYFLSNGTTVVGYERSKRNTEGGQITFFNEDGEVDTKYTDKAFPDCCCMNIGKDESVWFKPEGGNKLIELNRGKFLACEFKLDVNTLGFQAFAVSDDRSRVLCACEDYDSARFYVVHLDDEGNYVVPTRFEFAPKDESGKTINVDRMEYYGCKAVCGSVMLLYTLDYIDDYDDYTLYYYDVNDLVE